MMSVEVFATNTSPESSNVNQRSIYEDENNQENDIAQYLLNRPCVSCVADEVTEIHDRDTTHTESESEQNEPKTTVSFREVKNIKNLQS